MKKLILVLQISFLVGAGLVSCRDTNGSSQQEETPTENGEEMAYRPNFHFTPASGWMNDPNGMFYLDGTYHLFFQHNPDDNVWGPMHWGHATSSDLITWEEKPIALYPDEHGTIFSGSAVVDHNNTSGLGDGTTPPVIAIFTYHDAEAAEAGREDFQTQGIAYSLDAGESWIKYEGNPVLDNPGIKDFRDPKVSWYAEENKWIMALAVEDHIRFYSSSNLLDWNYESEFGSDIGAHGGVWECPDLFKLRVDDTNEEKWVLLVSINPGGPNIGSATQYFIGDFDGTTFTPDESIAGLGEEHDYWIDFGKDNYAGVTWNNIPEPEGRELFMGWMSNWKYGQEVPTETWRSAMTLPRELGLTRIGETYRVTSQPVDQLENYISETYTKDLVEIDGLTAIETSGADLSKAVISFEVPELQGQDYEFILSNDEGEELRFGYSHSDRQFFIDRSNSGIIDFGESFADKISTAPRISNAENLRVQAVLDKTSIELFFDDGSTVMTEIFFPKQPYQNFSAESNDPFELDSLEIKQLNFKQQ